MSQSEIDAMSDKEFRAVSPFEKKSCYDCKHVKCALSWWCSNEDAIKARGTRIPGCIKCTYWEPDWDMIGAVFKTSANGYKKKIIRTIVTRVDERPLTRLEKCKESIKKFIHNIKYN